VFRLVVIPKRVEIPGRWKKFHIENFHNLYYFSARRTAFKIVVGKHERKRSVVRPRCETNDSIVMDPRKIGCGWDSRSLG
jgi:hypothetical protein